MDRATAAINRILNITSRQQTDSNSSLIMNNSRPFATSYRLEPVVDIWEEKWAIAACQIDAKRNAVILFATIEFRHRI